MMIAVVCVDDGGRPRHGHSGVSVHRGRIAAASRSYWSQHSLCSRTSCALVMFIPGFPLVLISP